MISTFYNKTFSVKRQTSTSGTRLDTFQTVSSGNSCVFRPIADRNQLFNESNFGKEYKMFCSNSIDVKPNDLIVIDSVNYGIAGTSYYQDLEGAVEDHLEIRIYKK